MASLDSEIIVGLDIGTTKICAIAGRRNEYGKVEILGVGKAESFGVMRGVVANIEKTVASIREAIAEAETRSGVTINDVHIGIAGQHIRSLQHGGMIIRKSTEDEISQEDIDRIISDMYKLAVPPGGLLQVRNGDTSAPACEYLIGTTPPSCHPRVESVIC